MANTKSAIKALKQNEKRRLINKSRKSRVKTLINSCLSLINNATASHDTVIASFKKVQSELSRAVGKGIFHKNTTARKISNLSLKINKKLVSQTII